MRKLLITLSVLPLCLGGCATQKETPRAQPENHPLELMMYLQRYGEEREDDTGKEQTR